MRVTSERYAATVGTTCALLIAGIMASPAEAQSAAGSVSPIIAADTVRIEHRSLKLDRAMSPPATHIRLERPEKVQGKTAQGDSSGRRPVQIGFPRSIPDSYRGDLGPRIEWTHLEDGAIAGTVSVTSPGATALRVAIRAELGPAGELRFFRSTGRGEHIRGVPVEQGFPVVTEEDFHEHGAPEVLWSPTVEGETLGIEVTLPSRKALSDFSLMIEQVSHIHVPLATMSSGFQALSCNNHVDVQCRTSEFPQGHENASMRIVYVENGRSYVCSGTLLNDTVEETHVPYVLTANHCVATGTVARTVETRWFYQRAKCGADRIDPRDTTTTGGADLLATSVAQDSTLLRLRRQPPGGLLHAGWSADPIDHPARVYGIHHPDGSTKKYAQGVTSGQADHTVCQDPVSEIGCITVRSAIGVNWTDGATEQGSSGSGLIMNDRLVGVLSGGQYPPSCGNDGDDHSDATYGSFSDFYRDVEEWLSPPTPEPVGPTLYSLPFATPGSNTERVGFLRIINHSDEAGEVEINAIDDAGERFGPAQLALEARTAVQLRTSELENGTARKGFSGALGKGTGNWRLEMSSMLDIEPLAYIRTSDGFVTSMHETAEEVGEGSNEYHVPFFNPGKNSNQVSRLRLINPGETDVNVKIQGVDDEGQPGPFGAVHIVLGPGMSHMLSARDLEEGTPETAGRLGIGTGKWRLAVTGDRPVGVMSLLELPTGHLTNLSRGHMRMAAGSLPPTPGSRPNLTVRSPFVDNGSPRPGQPITLFATVHNVGTAGARPTTLRYVRSYHGSSTYDTELQLVPVEALGPGTNSRKSVTVSVPSKPGAYYYGACVDTIPEETEVADNCSDPIIVTVSDEEGEPFTGDLECSGTPIREGSSTYDVEMTGTVCANVPAYSVEVLGYVDETILLGSDFLGDMVENECKEFDISGRAELTLGTCHISIRAEQASTDHKATDRGRTPNETSGRLSSVMQSVGRRSVHAAN